MSVERAKEIVQAYISIERTGTRPQDCREILLGGG